MDGSDFQRNKPQRCEIGIKNEKNEAKIFYFGDHNRPWTVISKKRSSPCFPIGVRPAASRVFPNLALRVNSLPTPKPELCRIRSAFPPRFFSPILSGSGFIATNFSLLITTFAFFNKRDIFAHQLQPNLLAYIRYYLSKDLLFKIHLFSYHE